MDHPEIDRLSSPSEADFKKFASCFPTGIVVVTTLGGDGELFGTTMNSVTCLSVRPPTYLMCFDRQSRTLEALAESKVFCLNILASDQQELSKIFASKTSDKFSQVSFTYGSNGVPVLSGVAAACEGRVTAEHDGGDHAIVLGSVSRVHIEQRAPLLYERGKFRIFVHDILSTNRMKVAGAL